MSALPVLFGDAEAFAVAGLQALLDDHDELVDVGTRLPNVEGQTDNRPARFVRVIRAGGTSQTVIDSPLLAIDCYGPTEAAAGDLARLVVALVALLDGTTVGGVFCLAVNVVGGPSNLPDPATALPRYTLAVALRLRGVAL